MKDNHASVIAMGHHADDHVETLIMRLARTSAAGIPAGIRRCRRWGMGSSSKSLDWAGSSGMDHWIVRPLLDVPKVGLMYLEIMNHLDSNILGTHPCDVRIARTTLH